MKFAHKILVVMPAVVLVCLAAHHAQAACHRCGCSQCQKVCRLVCDEKELEVTCWDSKCEEFCVPGHCKLGCKHCAPACTNCGSGCSSCGDCDSCTSGCDDGCDTCKSGSAGCAAGKKKFVWRDTIPGCARIFTKKVLLRKVEKKKVKTYKWVLEDLCSNCQQKCDSVTLPPGTKIPEVPAEAKAAEVTMIPVHVEPIEREIRLMEGGPRYSLSD